MRAQRVISFIEDDGDGDLNDGNSLSAYNDSDAAALPAAAPEHANAADSNAAPAAAVLTHGLQAERRLFVSCNRRLVVGTVRMSLRLFPGLQHGDTVPANILICQHDSNWDPAAYVSSMLGSSNAGAQQSVQPAQAAAQHAEAIGPYAATLKRMTRTMQALALTTPQGVPDGPQMRQLLGGTAGDDNWDIVLQEKVRNTGVLKRHSDSRVWKLHTATCMHGRH
jgi:hypothetical protein